MVVALVRLFSGFLRVLSLPPGHERLRIYFAFAKIVLKLHVGQKIFRDWRRQEVMGLCFKFDDPAKFVASFEKIFLEARYYFKAQNQQPLILDCGESFGLAAAYFRYIYPRATVMSFETEAQCRPLSQFIRKPVDLIRLDFEGYEASVLDELSTSSRMAMVRDLIVEFRHDLENDYSLPIVLKALRTYRLKFNSRATDKSTQEILIFAKRRPHISAKRSKPADTRQLTFKSAGL
jgi:hypothetical protein